MPEPVEALFARLFSSSTLSLSLLLQAQIQRVRYDARAAAAPAAAVAADNGAGLGGPGHGDAAARARGLHEPQAAGHHGNRLPALRHRADGPDRRDREQGHAALPRAQPAGPDTVDQGRLWPRGRQESHGLRAVRHDRQRRGRSVGDDLVFSSFVRDFKGSSQTAYIVKR